MKSTLAIAFLTLFTQLSHAAYPPLPEYAGDTSGWGQHIQRTMGLLAESRPESRQAVKILFYGQSIVGGQWHAWVERELRRRYPDADLVVENLALGGYAADKLYKTVTQDVLLSQPDLVVFHVYGHHIHYEEIIHTIRQRTAAEVMIMTDHWGKRSQRADGSLAYGGWSKFYDRYLPLVAQKYECERVDVRWSWKAYLEQHQLQAGDLLTDGIHLNEHGAWLMARLALRQMLYRPGLMTDTSRQLVSTLRVGEEGDLQWDGRTLELAFEGSRVDVLRSHAGGAGCTVTIDGKRPSTIPELTRHTRTTSIVTPYEWPEIMRIGFNSIPEPQTWTLTLISVDSTAKTFTFDLEGSVTGPDGSGENTSDFVSNSGQVTIAAEDWRLSSKGDFRKGCATVGMKIRWQTLRLGHDLYLPCGRLERDRLVGHTLMSGLRNGRHTVTLTADGVPPPISHIRVYRPMLSDGPFEDMDVSPGDAVLERGLYEAPTPLHTTDERSR